MDDKVLILLPTEQNKLPMERTLDVLATIGGAAQVSTTLEEHCIVLTSSAPVRQRLYPVPFAMRQTLCDELEEMENLRIIKKNKSPYASPVVVVKKKEGSNRACIDYRQMNKLRKFDPHLMIPLADVFQGMENDKNLSKIGLSKG
ncbi:Zinc finger protein [Plakobranchus ocellatus]|uniref:Zinc finger protein n=1 Tax=Plakobranchus ocellatus TaxID=259542 RepID=A0AAV4D2A4_9GAST|nr:Zinc finger protein [Plakobranchus ocellatus]